MRGTHVDAALKCSEHRSHGLTDEGYGGEDTGLADEDIQ